MQKNLLIVFIRNDRLSEMRCNLVLHDAPTVSLYLTLLWCSLRIIVISDEIWTSRRERHEKQNMKIVP